MRSPEGPSRPRYFQFSASTHLKETIRGTIWITSDGRDCRHSGLKLEGRLG